MSSKSRIRTQTWRNEKQFLLFAKVLFLKRIFFSGNPRPTNMASDGHWRMSDIVINAVSY